jgi:hypothetical protein
MSDADLFTDEPAPAGDLFTDEPAPKSLGGFAENAVNNLDRAINPVNIVKGLGSTLKEGLYDIPKAAGESSIDLLRGTAKAATGGGLPDDMVEAVRESPIIKKTAEMTEPIAKDPLGYAYKNPVDAAGLLLAGAGIAKPFLGAAAEAPAIKAAGIPKAMESEIPRITEPAEAIPTGGKEPLSEAPSRLPPDPNAPPPPVTPPPPAAKPGLGVMGDEALNKANEVKNYISKGFEGYAKKSGAAADIADYVQEKSQMMAAQQMGATPLQARQIGHEGMRALGQYALDNDIVSPTTGLKGMRAKNTDLNNAAGEGIGQIRKEADSLREPTEHNVDVLQAIRQKYDPIFSRGSRSGEAGAYAKALEDLEDAKPTFQGMADFATKMNKAANEANRLNQPHGAYTDIANDVSHINNERIKALVGPQKATKYEQFLRDFGATKKIGEFLKRKEAGEVKRMGPGSMMSNLTQKAMDEFGYRAGAKVANKLSTAFKARPASTGSIPSMFKEFINQVEDVNHEVTGLYKGGMIPDDVRAYVGTKGC